MDKIDWKILDSLTDDYESLEQIDACLIDDDFLAKENLKNRIIALLKLGYIRAFNDEGLWIDEDTEKLSWDCIWFGLTEKGAEGWEDNSGKFCGEKANWEDAYVIRKDYKASEGFVYARNEEKCIQLFNKVKNDEKELITIDDKFEIYEVDEIKYKYYKTLKGGYKLLFTFTKLK